MTEWREFQAPDLAEIKSRLGKAVVFDARNIFHTESVLKEGLDYLAVGKRI